MEEWKDVKGYEAFYEVSNKGNVRTKGRLKRYPSWSQHVKPRLLKPSSNGGYLQVVLYDVNGKAKTIKVHRIVAINWINNPEEHPIINHKDKNRTNNCIENLEWCSNQYNILHGYNRLYELTSPEGTLLYTNNLSDFCNKNSIQKSNMNRVLKGHRNHAGGWKVKLV